MTSKAQEREIEALRLARLSVPYHEIADRLGYANASGAWKAVQRGLQRQPKFDRETEIAFVGSQLGDLYAHGLRVLATPMALVHNGRVVFQREDDGTLVRDDRGRPVPVVDQRVVVRALELLLRVNESRRALAGSDAPQRHRLTVVPDEALDEEEQRLVALLGGREAVEAQLRILDAPSRAIGVNTSGSGAA